MKSVDEVHSMYQFLRREERYFQLNLGGLMKE